MSGGLDDFLWARAEEIEDDDRAEILFDVVSDLREIDSEFVQRMALLEAARFSDHPDYRAEWRV